MGRYTDPPYYLTAYGIAVKHGYRGTEAEWIDMIQNDARHSSEAAEASAEDSEAWAVGKRDGEDIPETDPAYHNNAAYHAAAASASAGAAASSASSSEAFGAGTRGGAPVASGDPAYQNNSPYFAAQADVRAEDSEAWAVGKRNGTDVPDTDPTYHNNSKHYADLSKDYADNIADPVSGLVTGWLAAHVDPDTGYVIDNSLTVTGAAADARAAGDAIGDLKSELWECIRTNDTQSSKAGGILQIKWETGGIANDGTDVPSPGKLRTKNYLFVEKFTEYTITVPEGYTLFISYYRNDVSKTHISNQTINATSNEVSKAITQSIDINMRFMLTPETGYALDGSGVTINITGSLLTKTVNGQKDRLAVGNRFDIASCTYNLRLNTSTGAEEATAGYVVSDYINIKGLYKINLSGSVNAIVFYDSSYNVLSVLASASSGDRIVISYDATYIRLSLPSENARVFKLLFEDETSTSAEYGYVAERRVSNVDASKQFADLTHKNRGGSNVLESATWYMQAGCGYDDYQYTKDSSKSIKMVASNGITLLDCRITPSASIDVSGLTTVAVDVFIDDITHVSIAYLEMIGTSFGKQLNASGMKTGWNRLYFNTFEGNTSTWVSCTKLRLYFNVNGNCNIWIAKIELIKNKKAKLIVIDDHSYSKFLEFVYPRLKTLGIPVTWALDPGRVGATVSADAGTILTQDEIDALAYDYNSEFSIHAWDSETPTNDMTPAQIMDDTHKCITYLREHGIAPTHIWRAAWTQNKAPNASAAYGMLEGCATSTDQVGPCAYPIQNMYSMPRYTIHGRTQAQIESMFDVLQKTHCMLLIYTHSVSENGGIHATPAEIGYFLDSVEDGVTNGWLEGTTFSRMMTYPD